MHLIEYRARSRLALTHSNLRRLPPYVRFHRVQARDPLHGLVRKRARQFVLLPVNLKVLSSCVSSASRLQYSAICKASVVAGKRIDLQDTAVVTQMRIGVLPLAIGRVLEPNRRRGRISASPVIAHIGP